MSEVLEKYEFVQNFNLKLVSTKCSVFVSIYANLLFQPGDGTVFPSFALLVELFQFIWNLTVKKSNMIVFIPRSSKYPGTPKTTEATEEQKNT